MNPTLDPLDLLLLTSASADIEYLYRYHPPSSYPHQVTTATSAARKLLSINFDVVTASGAGSTVFVSAASLGDYQNHRLVFTQYSPCQSYCFGFDMVGYNGAIRSADCL